MAEKPKKEPHYVDKYLTITLKYKEDENANPNYNVLKISNVLTTALWQYNSNISGSDVPFDLFGIYMDYDDIPISDQNKINDEAKQDIHDKERK